MKKTLTALLSLLLAASLVAQDQGLRHVYTGNVHDPAGQTTRLGRREVRRNGGINDTAPCHQRRRRANLISGQLSIEGRCWSR